MRKKIIEFFNENIKNILNKKHLVFGQNITKGSRISGMTNFLDKLKNLEKINTQNSENSLIGFGLGLMLSGRDSIYFVKQLDFILLGFDHLVNTVNSLKLEKLKNNFSIITYIVDSGYEGPQSRLHNLQDISSLTNCNCIYLIFPNDIKYNLKKIKNYGVNIFCLSQKYSKSNFNINYSRNYNNGDIYQYNLGKKLTIVAVGFSAYHVQKLIEQNIYKDCDFFVICNPSTKNMTPIIKSAKKTKNLHIFDDSRVKYKNISTLIIMISKNKKIKINKYFRKETIKDLYVNSDEFKPAK